MGDLGSRVLASLPEELRAQMEPFIPGIVQGIHAAFSIATAATFTVGIITVLVAAGLVLFGLPGGRMGESTAAKLEASPTEA